LAAPIEQAPPSSAGAPELLPLPELVPGPESLLLLDPFEPAPLEPLLPLDPPPLLEPPTPLEPVPLEPPRPPLPEEPDPLAGWMPASLFQSGAGLDVPHATSRKPHAKTMRPANSTWPHPRVTG
jgi:hypothetical protein